MAAAAPVATWKQDTIDGLERGSRVWYKASATTWIGATLQSVSAQECSFVTDSPAGPETGDVSPTHRHPARRMIDDRE